jgi:hypothetical protein
MSKELYLSEYERIRSKLEELGCPADLADEIAAERAYPAMVDRLADRADAAKDRAKESRS